MKIVRSKFAGVVSAVVLVAWMITPAAMQAQANATAKIHGHVTSPIGAPLANSEIRLTTDKTPGNKPDRKYDYTFPVDANGNYTGDNVKPGDYVGIVSQQNKNIDYIPVTLKAGDDKALDFDMTRKEFMDKLTPEEKKQLEEYKKSASAANAANAKIANLNGLLTQARNDTNAGNYEAAIKAMTDATTTKPDEPLLWLSLGDAQLGDANAAYKAAGNKATDPAVQAKFAKAEDSYKKALDVNSKNAKPKPEYTATADNQLGQVLGKEGKTKDAAAAFDEAAKADPAKAATYYYNEAATLFNTGDMTEAASAADKAVQADPTKAEAYYIKGQALVQKATVDPKTQKIVAPPECVEAYQKYLELAPTGPHAEEVKSILQGIGADVKSSFKAKPGKK